jgi:alpha-methylacyl-CoA racemase
VSGNGPLAGLKILEVESIGPGPFAAMALADLGADVLRIARPSHPAARSPNPVLGRGRTATLTLDLKSTAGAQRLLELVGHADAMIEGFRPGVMERMGLGPEPCLSRNPRLVYGRVTGWGRAGPLAQSAGHDINYIALTGALHACGTADSGPVPPLNLVGDLGGGGLLLAFGVVCALLEARNSGLGQVVDVAMTGGTALLMGMIYGMHANGRWSAGRAGNILDGSAYFYTCYSTADGGWMAVGAIEPEFRLKLLQLLGLAEDAKMIMAAPDNDASVRARLAQIFRSRTRAEWQQVFDGTDACVTPVLQIDEVMNHEQNRVQGNFALVDGAVHPGAAPSFSRTPPLRPGHGSAPEGSRPKLEEWGLSAADVE